MYSIILCGGSGTRLWPLSRANFPKQFLSLYSENSLLQETFLRMAKIIKPENIFFITNQNNYFNVFNQIKNIYPKIKESQIIIEPKSVNTAPAISLAVKYLTEIIKIKNTDPIICVHSDAYIAKPNDFLKIIKIALKETKNNIGTIGITPTAPETGYGYIKKDVKNKIKNYSKVLEFKEKPNPETAKNYLRTGGYVWNSGMFIFNSKIFSEELKKYSPEIFKYFNQNYQEFYQNFPKLPKISIDHAVLEKSQKIIVFEGNFGWSDIGSFDSLAELNKNNKNKHININSKNIYIHSSSNRLVATIGIEDINIIESNDSILIQKKGQSENVKQIVDRLREQNLQEIEDNLLVYRPWGKYEILINTPTYKVKKITVHPGAKLSLQQHQHRAEHWIVVSGTAKIVNGDQEIFLTQNQSSYIPAETKHRLSNPEKNNLEIIEVQTGNYLGEDDIIRFDDIYHRK